MVPGILIGWSADPWATASNSFSLPSYTLARLLLLFPSLCAHRPPRRPRRTPSSPLVAPCDHPPRRTMSDRPTTSAGGRRPPTASASAAHSSSPLARSITDVTIPTIMPSSRKRKKKVMLRTFSLSCLCQPLINRGNSRSSVLRSTSAIPPTTRISLPMPSLLQVARPPILRPSSTLTLVSPPTQPVHPVFFNCPYPICRLRAPPPLRHSRVQTTPTAFKGSVLPVQAPQKPGLA